ncbi:hypothetical protein FNF31_07970 [Cafeteria roenbergensis]|uniref:EF-hand domain-containing protein n=1 Tax=Cafeteria roenbergensis TaxID=33653 RepID=A0A5A8BZF7_CAFRO|nr:hypothetical protein FNF31_07970 [Cafeteria roenbergensis]
MLAAQAGSAPSLHARDRPALRTPTRRTAAGSPHSSASSGAAAQARQSGRRLAVHVPGTTLGPMALQAARHAAYRELDALLPRDGWNLAAVGGSAHVSAELPADVAVPPGQSGSRRFPRELSDVLCEAFALTDRKIIVPTPDSSPDRAWTAQEAGQLVRCVALSSEVAPFDTSAFRAADATSRVLVPGLHASSRSWRGMVQRRRQGCAGVGRAGAVLPCTGDRSSEPSVSVDAFLAFRSSLSLAAAEAETANAPFAAEWAVRRVASGLARPLASGRPGYLAFDDFVWLALAEEDRMAGASIGFWCRVLDTDDDGFIGALDVAAAMRHRKLEGGLAAACATSALGAGSLAGEAAAEEAAESQADCGCSALEQSTAALLLRDCFGPAGCITPFRVTAALVRRRRCGAILYRMLIEGVAAGGAD